MVTTGRFISPCTQRRARAFDTLRNGGIQLYSHSTLGNCSRSRRPRCVPLGRKSEVVPDQHRAISIGFYQGDHAQAGHRAPGFRRGSPAPNLPQVDKEFARSLYTRCRHQGRDLPRSRRPRGSTRSSSSAGLPPKAPPPRSPFLSPGTCRNRCASVRLDEAFRACDPPAGLDSLPNYPHMVRCGAVVKEHPC